MENGDRINIVGQRVKDARRRHQPALTQGDLARRLSRFRAPIDRAGISKLETGSRCVLDYEVVALARALDVSVGWLLGGRRKR